LTHHPTHTLRDLNLSKTTFLVADNKMLFRDMVQSALSGAGAKSVKHASSVEKAIESLNRYGQEIHCVICDWDMAPIGGLELLRMIRSRNLAKTSPRTPVVILTARASSAAVKAAMAMDVNGFGVTPFSFDKMVKIVTQALTRTWMLQQPAQYLAVPGVDPLLEQHTPPPHHHPAGHAGIGPPPTPLQAMGAKPLPRRETELRSVRMCSLAQVHPGQVLARDLRDPEGHLLLSTGAVLKPTLINRLKDAANGHVDSYHLWVGERD
jgi:DNA-binding NarL/FixJ family response regulator